jgi:hypothetical protein
VVGGQFPLMTCVLDTGLQRTITLLAEILSLCNIHRHVTEFANARLAEICSAAASVIQPKVTAMDAIAKHLEEQKREKHPIRPQIKHYWMIANQLAKMHNIQFDLKRSCKKKKVMDWLDQHWDTVKDEFFVLLNKIEQTVEECDHPSV